MGQNIFRNRDVSRNCQNHKAADHHLFKTYRQTDRNSFILCINSIKCHTMSRICVCPSCQFPRQLNLKYKVQNKRDGKSKMVSCLCVSLNSTVLQLHGAVVSAGRLSSSHTYGVLHPGRRVDLRRARTHTRTHTFKSLIYFSNLLI